MQIEEAIDKYFKYLRVEKGVSNDTILSYHYDLNEFFKVLKKEDTDEFNANDITDFIKLESRRFLSSSTIIRRSSGKAVCGRAYESHQQKIYICF